MFSCIHLPHGHGISLFHTKKPINPRTKGYTLEKQDWLEADTWHVWRINNPTNTIGVLDKIGFDLVGNRICIFDASNKSDKFPDSQKMRLRDLMMGIWATEHHKEPGELRCILVQNTVDEDIQKLRDKVYDIMEADKAESLTIKSDHDSEEEKKAYHILTHKFAFGHGARHMLEEYEGLKDKKITKFVLSQPPGRSLQFEIIIG